jgi:prepilin peptidase CpaA
VHLMYLDIWVAILIVSTMPVAMITDLNSRRIPNLLTFPLLAAAIVVRIVFQGWPGLGLALVGAVFAPAILVLLHGGKGPGMGDLKLAAGVGAALGPITSVVSMLATAVIGGLLAVVWLLKPGGLFADFLPACFSSLPGFRKIASRKESSPTIQAPETMPYGVAIGLGAFLILAVRWWTGHNVWFL